MAGPGGKRPGAGRKPGVPNKVTRKARERAAKGDLPLDVLLRGMRYFARRADRERNPAEKERLTILAGNMGKQAADYLHPKLASTTLATPPGQPLEVKDVSDMEVARRLAFLLSKAARGKP